MLNEVKTSLHGRISVYGEYDADETEEDTFGSQETLVADYELSTKSNSFSNSSLTLDLE